MVEDAPRILADTRQALRDVAHGVGGAAAHAAAVAAGAAREAGPPPA
jgi:hypothetical protein